MTAPERWASAIRQNSPWPVEIATPDSHDHVYGISVSGARTLLFFEKRSQEGEVSHPQYRAPFDGIFSAYGEPIVVQAFNEEAMSVHHRIWKHGDERLALKCFESSGRRHAERVDLYLEAPG